MILENLVKELSKSQVFQFFPDLPLIDFCIFNASGWDRIKERLSPDVEARGRFWLNVDVGNNEREME